MADQKPWHARDEDLIRIPLLLSALRSMPELVERRPGYFSLRGRAVVHFHANEDDVYADARLAGAGFERVRVTTVRAQRELASRIRGQVRRVHPDARRR